MTSLLMSVRKLNSGQRRDIQVNVFETKEWSSIDIYLFSNGQQYSPPRKYHLRSEELQWWGNTMSYLGRTQYGSGHSTVELYAINGTKINGPLELVNGAAYVAVEPPDSFVNTGYEEYILRATRSWEKRMAQKSYNTEMSNPDLERSKDPEVQSNTENVIKSEDIADAVLPITPQKTRQAKPYQRLQRKCIPNLKQIQKKKSCDTNSSTIKRICAETDKVFPCPKKTAVKKNGYINRKPSTIVPRKLNETMNQEQSYCCKKRASIKPESIPNMEAPDVYDAAPVREPQIIDLFNNEESESMSFKNDRERYSMIKQTLSSDNNQELKKHSENNLEKLNDHIFYKNDGATNEAERDLQESVPLIDNNNENKSYNTLNGKSEKQVIDEYVAHMNKGGLLLLKLKVKLKDCKSIFNRDKFKNIQTAPFLSNLPKTEKTSQVDINISFSGELLKSNDQQYIQDKSLQSLINKLYAAGTDEIDNKNPKIIILQCACRDHSDIHKCCVCGTFNGCEAADRKCETTVNEKLNETFTSCDCYNESLRASKDEYALKNVMITEPVKDRKEDRLSNANGTRVKNLAQIFERSNGTIVNDKNINSNNKQNTNDMSMKDNDRQSVVLTRFIGLPVFEKDTENQIEEENNVPNSKTVCSKSTQTDWYNVLLEARLHEDDNYTFHLPSLYILKQCNL